MIGAAIRMPSVLLRSLQIFHASLSAIVAVLGGEVDMGLVEKLRE
jgi:hypothetical protein